MNVAVNWTVGAAMHVGVNAAMRSVLDAAMNAAVYLAAPGPLCELGYEHGCGHDVGCASVRGSWNYHAPSQV